MKIFKSAYFLIVMILVCITFVSIIFAGCTASQKIKDKAGVQLWSENCQRCHNTPPAATYSPEQWETVGLHMQSRALLTDKEREKIVDFLKQ